MACPKSIEEKTHGTRKLVEAGEYEKALKVLKGLLEKDPDCHHTMAYMGKVHKEYGSTLISRAREIARAEPRVTPKMRRA
ncbi:MAG: hypothetical protein KGH61_03105 [Candidatus Micrarchaeota archaeon]|nr:hypothetical protein [Candidatus Micrarchaeota archaeon]MDE1847911.1 hypothetical protein [Candidatus Micrarchaeota archaeon]MDE1864537.1 hypothetical protein [Candidatus Micrarchaeota archaeon]